MLETKNAAHPKAAFEIVKGPRKVMNLSEADVERYLDPRELLDGLEEGFAMLYLGHIQSPHRPEIRVPGKGFSLAMPAWQPGRQICVKVVNVFDANLELDLPNHLAHIMLFDPDTGATTCIMDGTYITGIRTAASAVLSARMLSRTDSRVATIVGAGVQGREHLKMLPLIREFDEILVYSLHFDDAERLARRHPKARAVRNLEEAVRRSDVVCLASHSPDPVIDAAWIRPGTHVSSVGYWPPRGEMPRELATTHHLFVETLDAFEPTPVGCAELAGLDPASATELGAVAAGKKPGRKSQIEITVYKAMGIAMEDMVAANLAYKRASREQGGEQISW